MKKFHSLHRKGIIALILSAGLAMLALRAGTVTFTGNYEGIFLLKGESPSLFEIKDDLYLGEEHRYIAGIDWENEKSFFAHLFEAHALAVKKPFLFYEWNEKEGKGYIRNYLPDGTQMFTAFSRFVDDGGKESSGLFVGGGLPSTVKDDDAIKMNETGMAYYDGTRWFHIWCNVNELMTNSRLETQFPSSWKFLGSRIIHHNNHDLIIESRHEIVIDGVPLRMQRTAFFRAGERYFILSIDIHNSGNRPVTYYYVYGDEPWLGNYGTSGGNVGWATDGNVPYLYRYKGRLDTRKLHAAGLFDYGNDAIGEGHDFTGTANFIEWFSAVEPFVFFSNSPYDFPRPNEPRVPLYSNTRFLGIQWGPRTLQPDQAEHYALAIGMAGRDPDTGFPAIPATVFKNFP